MGGRSARLELEKSRLEAFLAAFPGEYCALSKDGSATFSKGFGQILGLKTLHSLADIQSRLTPGDSAALEGLYDSLERTGMSFSLAVSTYDERKILKISGSQGFDLKHEERYEVLWIEDITREEKERKINAQAQAQDKEELEQLQVALSALSYPLWLRDSKQNIIWCNEIYAQYINSSVQDVLSEQKELAAQALKKKNMPKGEHIPGRELAQKALKEDKTLNTRVHAVVKGERILMKISEIPLKTLGLTLGISLNITREEELETKLKRYESSNKDLLEQLRSAIAIYTADERLEFYNSAFSQLWGLEDQWLNTGPKLGEIMEKLRETRRLPEQADFRQFKQSWLAMFRDLIGPHEDMMYLPDGTALRRLVVPHSMGGIMMTFEDVSSRLELESSYNTLIAVQKETLDNLGEAVFVYGSDGRLKLWNPAFTKLWKLNPEDLEGEPHISKILEKKRPFFNEEEWDKRKEEFITRGLGRTMHEGRLTRNDGVLIDFTTVPLPDGGVLVTHIDVTDSVHVENALREKNAALETAENLKLDFLANVSYQLRTPLNAIMGFTEILDQEYFGSLNERQKEYTSDMKDAGKSLLHLINDILDLSTLEAGYMNLERQDVKVKELFGSVFELVNDWARKEEIEIILKCPKNIGSISADERRLQQVLINLIRNAITFTPSKGTITLSASRKKEGLSISVRDTGIGISKEDRKLIFEPFERARSGFLSSRASKSGAGLGLSLVRNIIALHGGSVDLQSEPGQGTTVTLFLPFTATKTQLKIPKQLYSQSHIN